MSLNEEQEKGLNVLKSGKNVFLTGSAGSGKSYLIKYFVEWCKMHNKKVAVTSTTGVSAILVNGTTLHSWAGIGLGEEDKYKLVDRVRKFKNAYVRWTVTKILIIDEVSMLSAHLMEKLDFIGRELNRTHKFFGGIQLVLSGDFAQLPPISAGYLFKDPIWELCVEKTVYLEQNMRQSDDVFRRILGEVRLGNTTEESINILLTRKGAYIDAPEGIVPTKLFSHKAAVEKINTDNLMALVNAENPLIKFHTKDEVKKDGRIMPPSEQKDNYLARIDKMCNGLKVLELAVGVQVMLLFNIDVKAGLSNGSRGVLVGFKNNIPIVRFMNGIECPIGHCNWEMKISEEVVGIRSQIPLSLAFASTIHKIQGATLDCACLDLGNTLFEFGQGYTALSRCKSLDKISIVTLDPNKLMCSPDVKFFYNNLSSCNLEKLKEELKEEEVKDESLCNVCFTNKKNCVFIPCGHIAACFECAHPLNKCPLCRKEINQCCKVFV